MMGERLRRGIAWLLGLTLLALAIVKVFSGHDPSQLLGATMFWSATAPEAAVGVAFLAGFRRTAACFTIVAMTSAIVVGLAWPQVPCGCLGTIWILNARQHLMLAAAFGTSACLLLSMELGKDGQAWV